MKVEEVSEILQLLGEIDIGKLDFTEQLYYMQTMHELAEKLKPIVTKYAMREQTKSTFLMKLGNDWMNKDED